MKYTHRIGGMFDGTNRAYEYKSWEKIEVGSRVVVETSSGFTVVKVVSCVPRKSGGFKNDMATKWVVCTIDTTLYERARAEQLMEEAQERLDVAKADVERLKGMS